jgi:hypothetical protein
MPICVLCEHDTDKHKIDTQDLSVGLKKLSIKCWYEKGQLTDSSFCGCNAGFEDVEISVSFFSRRSDD